MTKTKTCDVRLNWVRQNRAIDKTACHGWQGDTHKSPLTTCDLAALATKGLPSPPAAGCEKEKAAALEGAAELLLKPNPGALAAPGHKDTGSHAPGLHVDPGELSRIP